jgi:hypothetical protein
MPLRDIVRKPVITRVVDQSLGDQKIGQEARLLVAHFIINPVTNEFSIMLDTQGEYRNLVAGELAGHATLRGLSCYPVPIYGNNNCAEYENLADPQDPRNGEVLYYRTTQQLPDGTFGDVWQRRLEDGTMQNIEGSLADVPEPVVMQGDKLGEQFEQAGLFALAEYHIQRGSTPEFGSKYGTAEAEANVG